MNNKPRIESSKMKTVNDLFKEHSQIAYPENLSGRVFLSIQKAAEKKNRQDQYAWGALFLTSLTIFVASAIHTTQVIASSSFGSYFSIIFSDSATALTLWKQITLSLIESLPFIEICIVFASIALVLWSIRNFSKTSPLFITHSNASLA
jgi:Na+/H+ antiporter NhaB